jgi:transposase
MLAQWDHDGMDKGAIIHLSSRARIVLEDIARHDGDGRTVRRTQALLWLDQGEPVQVVAERLNVSRQMLYEVVERYESRLHLPVLERVQDSLHPGRPATKRELAAHEIEILLGQAPASYGYRGQVWTTPMLKTQVEYKHQIELSDDTVQRALHDLRYRCKRPRYVLARREPHWRQAKGGCKTA